MTPSEPDRRPESTPIPDPLSGNRRERRALWTGLGVSVVLHLVAVAIYPLLMDSLAPERVPADPMELTELRPGIEVLLISEVVDVTDPAPEPAVRDPDVAIVVPELDPGDPAPDEVEPLPPERRRTVAERLRPRMVDPRLWMPMDRDITDLTDHERAELLLRGMIRSWNDSMAVAAALAEDARDWTYTDEDGRRWGLSPGRLHLGDFSIPLPFSFEAPPGRRDELARRQWEMQDMARAASTAAIQETWAERAREIRRRMENERGNRRPDGG
jgi:hypothetical protein